ncbi:MAG: DUF2520 domain-containing protein [Hylemonella sp.]|uniref:Rossmann-like and DUF2520 domain-containing protein n=1 Tax=Hylemonella sp. TaxID=2066020 RepID=UPI0022C0ED2D|nr:Rossmann-like and DUF2520 domain-containing protein [Hylemonella sp.]MCZ8251298.1 DUF2520 domain-containing protein [Hylemonella sp.]
MSSPQPTLNLVGAGRVGKTLGRLWQQAGVLQLQDVLTTSTASAQAAVDFIGAGRAVSTVAQMRPADLWLLAVPDRHIAACAQLLATCNQPPTLAFHASGALAAAELAPLQADGWRCASAHGILSFADPARALQQFPGTVCALEGDAEATARLQPLFTAIGAQCFALASEHKLIYHAAAVWATNFLPVLQAQAEALWQHSGLPAELLPGLRERLLRNALDNLLALGPAGALTGPAARGDTALVQRQGLAVAALDAQAGAAYAALSALAHRLARDGRL